jgi:hypothetical protein
MSTEQVLGLALALVAFFGGMWVRTIQADLKEVRDKLRDYVLREDLHRELEGLGAALARIEQKVDAFVLRIEDKLATKVDK